MLAPAIHALAHMRTLSFKPHQKSLQQYGIEQDQVQVQYLEMREAYNGIISNETWNEPIGNPKFSSAIAFCHWFVHRILP